MTASVSYPKFRQHRPRGVTNLHEAVLIDLSEHLSLSARADLHSRQASKIAARSLRLYQSSLDTAFQVTRSLFGVTHERNLHREAPQCPSPEANEKFIPKTDEPFSQ